MIVKLEPAALRQTKGYEYASRFLFGGAITALTGWIAKEFSPGVGGLFLAFPAIFPASATLIDKHEREKKQRVGLTGAERARVAAGADAAGAAMGSIGLVVFALWTWNLLSRFSPGLVLSVATWRGSRFL
jgi:hypothetical protein